MVERFDGAPLTDRLPYPVRGGMDERLTPFRPLSATDRAALEQEAERLLPFVGGENVSCGSPIATMSS